MGTRQQLNEGYGSSRGEDRFTFQHGLDAIAEGFAMKVRNKWHNRCVKLFAIRDE